MNILRTQKLDKQNAKQVQHINSLTPHFTWKNHKKESIAATADIVIPLYYQMTV